VRLCTFHTPPISNVTGYNRFADDHAFVKPNDIRALELMDLAAWTVMREYPDVVLAYGQSDEYRYVTLPPSRDVTLPHKLSFLLRKSTKLYNRRQSKITSLMCSLFTSTYVMLWPQCFPDTHLRYAPSFDARIVLYPGAQEVRDYFSWRQADGTWSTSDEPADH
jgi:tRNA(His) guanylyltransferase